MHARLPPSEPVLGTKAVRQIYGELIGKIFEEDCHFWSNCVETLRKRYGQKLRRIILLHLGLVFFRFAYGRDRNPLKSKLSGLPDVSLSSNTIYFYLLRLQEISNDSRKFPKLFLLLLDISELWKSGILKMLGKMGAVNFRRSV